MARMPRTSPIWLIIAAGCLAVLLWFAFSRPAAQNTGFAELDRAYAIWSRQVPPSYHIRVQQQIGTATCQQDIAVRGEQIVDVLANDCGQPATWTASHLFSYVNQLKQQKTQCYPSDQLCACYAFQDTQASYDAQLGYPQQVTYSWRMQPNLLSRDYWQYGWKINSLPNCDHGQGDIVVKVLSLRAP